MKILVIGAHPADCFDLAGGTIYQHTKNNHEVHLVTLTKGMRSHLDSDFLESNGVTSLYGDPAIYDRIDTIKQNEFKIAARILGVKEEYCTIFDFLDEPLVEKFERIIKITAVIRAIKPDIVITHHPNEYAHWDHSICGRMVCRASKAAIKLPQNKNDMNSYNSKHWASMVYFFAVQFRPEVARLGIAPQAPDILIELDEFTIKAKVDAMCCLRSQGHTDKKAMMERMNSMESEMGRADGLKWSEGFIFYYPLKRTLLLDNPIDKRFYK